MQSVTNEEELIKRVVESQKWSGFSRVTQISTIKISPDIDFLRIDKDHNETVGYEFKLLRFRKDWNRVNLMPMYTGIGEAIQYFRFGVDKSYLMLGMSKETPTEALSDIYTSIHPLQIFDIEKKSSLGVCVWVEILNRFETPLSATRPYFMSKELEHLKECLLRREFKYHREFKFGSSQ